MFVLGCSGLKLIEVQYPLGMEQPTAYCTKSFSSDYKAFWCSARMRSGIALSLELCREAFINEVDGKKEHLA